MTTRAEEHAEYGWRSAEHTCAHAYLLPAVFAELGRIAAGRSLRVLDLGCGNGSISAALAREGHEVVGIDASTDGIAIARATHPDVCFHVRSIYEPGLLGVVGRAVDCVVSLEVIEHLYYPKQLFARSLEVLRPGGFLILSTPYHGYLKNLALALTNGWDRHLGVDWDGGHIKFFSMRSLRVMAESDGLRVTRLCGVGRMPGFWKSMVLVAQR